jgi:hypothetical protein
VKKIDARVFQSVTFHITAMRGQLMLAITSREDSTINALYAHGEGIGNDDHIHIIFTCYFVIHNFT